jgi:SSS family solute:Na+ symporter
MARPLDKPVELPVDEKMDMTPSRSTKLFGGVVIAATLMLYVAFW